jgi:hypothetical protein
VESSKVYERISFCSGTRNSGPHWRSQNTNSQRKQCHVGYKTVRVPMECDGIIRFEAKEAKAAETSE